ncbi:fimbrial protein, partial [Mesorhizobium sp. M1A.F.Ca.IN.020.06.1.1]
QALSGNRLSIDAELADGSRSIFLYDIAERRVIGQFAIRNK